MILHAFLALVVPLSFIESNTKILPKPESLSTKLQFSMFFSPATNIVPRAWNPDKDARRKRKSYQVVAPISATYPQLSPSYHENVTSFVNIENSNDREKSTTTSTPTPVTGGRSTQATASSTPPPTPLDTVEPDYGNLPEEIVTNYPTLEDKDNLDLELSELSTDPTSTNTEAPIVTKVSSVMTTTTTLPKTSISNGTTLSSVISNKQSTPTVAPSSSESATEVTFPLQIPTSLDLDEERELGSSELEDVSGGPETVQPSSTESGLRPELTEISETEETTREAGDGIVDGDCYTHEIMLLGQCVVMCGRELLRFCG